jgi:dihydrofolate reductase
MKWHRKKNEMIKDFEDYSMAHKTFTLGYLLERKCYKLIKGRLDDLKMIIFF